MKSEKEGKNKFSQQNITCFPQKKLCSSNANFSKKSDDMLLKNFAYCQYKFHQENLGTKQYVNKKLQEENLKIKQYVTKFFNNIEKSNNNAVKNSVHNEKLGPQQNSFHEQKIRSISSDNIHTFKNKSCNHQQQIDKDFLTTATSISKRSCSKIPENKNIKVKDLLKRVVSKEQFNQSIYESTSCQKFFYDSLNIKTSDPNKHIIDFLKSEKERFDAMQNFQLKQKLNYNSSIQQKYIKKVNLYIEICRKKLIKTEQENLKLKQENLKFHKKIESDKKQQKEYKERVNTEVDTLVANYENQIWELKKFIDQKTTTQKLPSSESSFLVNSIQNFGQINFEINFKKTIESSCYIGDNKYYDNGDVIN
jgi:hypothetical protein